MKPIFVESWEYSLSLLDRIRYRPTLRLKYQNVCDPLYLKLFTSEICTLLSPPVVTNERIQISRVQCGVVYGGGKGHG